MNKCAIENTEMGFVLMHQNKQCILPPFTRSIVTQQKEMKIMDTNFSGVLTE